MNHPYVLAQLQRVNEAIGITAFLDRQFPNAAAEAGQRLRNIGHAAIGDNRKRLESLILRPAREITEIPSGRLDP